MLQEYILTLSCPDKPGIVAKVSTFLARHNCNIQSSAQYGDPESLLFFMRVRFKAAPDSPDQMELFRRFTPIAAECSMKWGMYRADKSMRVLIMVSHHGHCLTDLLYRMRIGALRIDVGGIVSNHQDFSDMADWYDIPYHYLPVTLENKPEQEEALLQLVEQNNIELVVLARYMQVLSPELCRSLYGRCINIHHSFLPGFKGARPYHQAYSRGVKLIGATAHYVTPDLDEGPIIEQGVERVDHAHSPEEMAAIGRDVESTVLARAVKNHLEHRVLLNGNKTVVLR